LEIVNAPALIGKKLAAPGKKIASANLTGEERIAEKSIELTTCAQLGTSVGKRMVWFGLTQAQERKYGYDAATNLGGRAFILQFKASRTITKRGVYKGQRLFQCQHDQMKELISSFGKTPNSCFYLLPGIGTFSEMQAVKGDLISNAYLVDISKIPEKVISQKNPPKKHRMYLDTAKPSVTIRSEPHVVDGVLKAYSLGDILRESVEALPRAEQILRIARDTEEQDRRHPTLFFKNAALIVIPD